MAGRCCIQYKNIPLSTHELKAFRNFECLLTTRKMEIQLRGDSLPVITFVAMYNSIIVVHMCRGDHTSTPNSQKIGVICIRMQFIYQREVSFLSLVTVSKTNMATNLM